MDADPIKLYPPFRQAEADLLKAGATHGSLISDEWLHEAFGIKEPRTIAEAEKNKLVFLRQFTCLSESLLQNHKMMLRRTRGVGYTVVLPEHQTKVAMADRTREVKAALARLAMEISHVDTVALTDSQRQENTNAIAKLGVLRGMVRKQLKSDPT